MSVQRSSTEPPLDTTVLAPGTRVAVRISYRGGRYAGWQRQPNASTVQQVVEEALGELLGDAVRVVGASRTDAGVHALAQWVHLDLPRAFPASGLVLGGNHHLPEDVRLLTARPVPADFHARRWARWKRYRYRLSGSRVVDALRAPFVAPLDGRADVRRMEECIAVFRGRHDFSAFAKTGGSHGDPVRTLHAARLECSGDEVVAVFEGEGFLRGMVRAMVGTLVELGLGARDLDTVRDLLAGGGERGEAGTAAPARGLCLDHIEFGDWTRPPGRREGVDPPP